VAVPVTDVDRSKRFHPEQVGLDADHDHRISDEFRFVQLTPPGSAWLNRPRHWRHRGQPGSTRTRLTKYYTEATAGDYDHLLQTTMR
jgi:hypothetical protein